MAYDAELAARLTAAIGDLPGLSERQMFGGVCFLLDGNMLGGVSRDRGTGIGRFMFRVGKPNSGRAEALPGAVPMVHGGRRMGGFFYVDAEGCSDATLAPWVGLALDHGRSLPPKDGH